MNNTFSIIEYQAFSKEDLKENFKERAERFYKELEDFAKNNEFFLGFKNKNTLKAKNYVGIIQTKSGVLEILPKCMDLEKLEENEPSSEDKEKLKEDTNSKYDKEKLKKYYELENISKNDDCYKKDCEINPSILLINMLKTLKNYPFKKSQISSLQIAKMSLFEVFITMFLDEFDSVYKKGLMRSYVSREENRAFLKGKLLFNEHIKSNLIHKERFFTSSDEFVLDIAPNRLIKSTLNFLKSKTSLNKFKIIKAMQMLDEVEFSTNYEKDFSFKISRHFDYYENILSWCKIFLQNQSFAPYKGKNEAFALLFPMEKLFENYVAYMFKLANPSKNIKTQSSGKYLISKNDEKCFMLKPDLYIENKMILDTKWKIPDDNEDEKKHGISQSDLYQMFAYANKYEIKEIYLIYPLCERTFDLREKLKTKDIKFLAQGFLKACDEHVKLKVFFAPLPF
ncbi:restriction endonuclease [Campylobacter lari]|nr:restriction endonuclease [Campylobacter lari]